MSQAKDPRPLRDILKMIDSNNTAISLINSFETQIERGFVFERLFDLIIKFGCCDRFPSALYAYKTGNMNMGYLTDVTNLQKYIKYNNLFSGKSGGASDITLYNKDRGRWVFSSCKYPSSDVEEKGVRYYDVQDIVSVAGHKRHLYTNYEIYLMVPNKRDAVARIGKANVSSEHITKHLKNQNILDMADLEQGYARLKKALHSISFEFEQINAKFCSKFDKGYLNLYFHQKMMIVKTMELIDSGETDFLWGWKCRAGKTFGVGGLIRDAYIRAQTKYDGLNVLIITPAPTETSSQFEDMLCEYKDFNGLNIINIKSGEYMRSIEYEDSNIIIVSKQLLQNYTGENANPDIQDLGLDLIVFDENHFGGTTSLSKSIIDTYCSKKTARVFLTATYHKPLREWSIPEKCRMFWDIEDEMFCKKRDINALRAKHGSVVDLFVDDSNKDDVLSNYDRMPEMVILTTMFDTERYDHIRSSIQDTAYGFSMETLFSMDAGNFKYVGAIRKVLRYISGSMTETDFKKGDKSYFGRITKISTKMGSRTILNSSSFTSQLWFLPFGIGRKISDVSECLAKLMLEDDVLKNYEILIINSSIRDNVKDIKARINDAEIKGKYQKKDGLILLAGNQCSLGITLPLVDVVFLMNNTFSSDVIMQMMYRCMSESADGKKKAGFVIDLNISRILNTVVDYNISGADKAKTVDSKISYIVNNELMRIDPDMFDTKRNKSKIIDRLIEIWRADPVNNLKTLLRKIERNVIELEEMDQSTINRIFMESMISDAPTRSKIKMDSDTDQITHSGQTIQVDDTDSDIDTDDSNSDAESDDTDDHRYIQTDISFTKDVLPYIIMLSCILTIDDNTKDFLEILRTIKANKMLMAVFEDQTMIWWNQKKVIDIVETLVAKYVHENSDTYNIAIQFKMSLQSLIDKPAELLELIDDCLKPKQLEKRKFGEVFTPMTIINEMLDKLPKAVWLDKNLKWFDPANGMGNFPIAIYIRLFESLKKVIPDDETRKRHILQNMLYMAELNKKNVFVCREIFNIDGKYKLNLYEGDSLKLDTQKVWKIEKFDIIVGNPPYNEELKRTGAKPLYNQFIDKFIDKCTHMLFIIPSRWFAGGKGLDKFRKSMLNRSDIVLIKHFDDATKIFGKMVNIEGGVNYFLKSVGYRGLSEFNGTQIKLNKYDILVDSKYYELIDALESYEKITKNYRSQDHYKIQTNDKRLVDDEADGRIVCYVSQQKGFRKYIDRDEITKDYDTWKVLTARANGNSKCFGNIFIGTNEEVHCKTYISFNVDSKNEAESLVSYMKCKMPNLLLSLRKISQDISESTCSWIPIVPLDQIWTDADVHTYFELTPKQIKLITDADIKGYKSLNANTNTKDDVSNDSDASADSIESDDSDWVPQRKVVKSTKSTKSTKLAKPKSSTTKADAKLYRVIRNPENDDTPGPKPATVPLGAVLSDSDSDDDEVVIKIKSSGRKRIVK